MELKLQKIYQEEPLVDALKRGDKVAFNIVYEHSWYKLFLMAYQRIRQKEPAQELVQNLFMKLWEKRDTLEINDLEAYLYSAMRHAIIDYVRAQLVVHNYIQYRTSHFSDTEETTERMVALDDVSEALEAGITKLPEKSQEVFRLSRLNNWPTDKIATHLNLSEKTVQYHLTKSLKFLRTYLREFTYTLLVYFYQS
jgi:RNA polymerase sigma-70 factor (family 1)